MRLVRIISLAALMLAFSAAAASGRTGGQSRFQAAAQLEALEQLYAKAGSGELKDRYSQESVWTRLEMDAVAFLYEQPDHEQSLRAWELWGAAVRGRAFLAGSNSDWRRAVDRINSQREAALASGYDLEDVWLGLAGDLAREARFGSLCEDSRPLWARAESIYALLADDKPGVAFLDKRLEAIYRQADEADNDQEWLALTDRAEKLLVAATGESPAEAWPWLARLRALREARGQVRSAGPPPDQNLYAPLAQKWLRRPNLGPGRSPDESRLIRDLTAKRVWLEPETEKFMQLVNLAEYEIDRANGEAVEVLRDRLFRLRDILAWGMVKCGHTQSFLPYSFNYVYYEWPWPLRRAFEDRMARLDELEGILALALMKCPWEQRDILMTWRNVLREAREDAHDAVELDEIGARLARLDRIAAQKIPYRPLLSDDAIHLNLGRIGGR